MAGLAYLRLIRLLDRVGSCLIVVIRLADALKGLICSFSFSSFLIFFGVFGGISSMPLNRSHFSAHFGIVWTPGDLKNVIFQF